MKNISLLIPLLFVLTLYARESLVLVQDLGMDRSNFPVIDIVENQNLILAKPGDLDLLKTRNIAYKILDIDVADKKYYLVHPFIDIPDETIPYSIDILKKYGRVLECFEKVVLMESDADRLHSMKEYRVKLDFVELEPMEFFPANNTILNPEKRETMYNPVLQEMLKRVNPDSVMAFEKKLVSFKTRHVQSQCSKNEFIPWVKETFKKYGCDSIISLSMGGNNSDEVIGVRKGKKDPSILKFVLLGGHCDCTAGSPETRHEGGNDNATGFTAVLEACRVHQYYTFDYTILYATHNGEETGLNGSRATCKMLTGAGAKAIGGLFSYDMFGMSKSNINFRVYDQNAGAKEFVTKMTELKNLYKLVQPASITTSSSSSISSDPQNYWKNGYVCIGHNFAGAGAGGIHTTADKMMPSYDKEHQAECAKIGIITTAEYAGVGATSIRDIKNVLSGSVFQYTQTPKQVLLSLDNAGKMHAGTFQIFNLQGKLVRTLIANPSTGKIIWDRKDSNGERVASNSVLLIRYSDASATYALKIVVK